MDAKPDASPLEPSHLSKTGDFKSPDKRTSGENSSSNSTQSTNDGRSSNEDDADLQSSRSRPNRGRGDASSDETPQDARQIKATEAGGSPLPQLNPSLERNGPGSSKGSALHNNGGCKPCAFYCFSHGGCYAGTNCNFCHLFHKSKSKSFDMMERGANAHSKAAPRQRLARKCGESSVESNESSKPKDDNSESAPSHNKRSPYTRVMFDETVGEEECATDVVKNSQTGLSADPTTLKCDFSSGTPRPSESLPTGSSFTYFPKAAMVRVGQRVDLLPLLDGSQPRVFAVSPELPPGLTIDKFTGVISGVPQKATEVSSVHFITCCEPLVNFRIQTASVHIQIQPGGVAPDCVGGPDLQLKGNTNPELQEQLQQLHLMLGALHGTVIGLASERERQQQQEQQQ